MKAPTMQGKTRVEQEKQSSRFPTDWRTKIPTLGEPLRTAVQSTKHRDQIPETWFRVTLGAFYSYKDRNFAKRMEEEDRILLDNFILADYNLLCLDPKVTAGHVKSFLRIKYGMGPQRLVQLLQTENLHQAVTDPANESKRQELGIQLDMITKAKEYGNKHPIVPHFQANSPGKENRRADLFTAEIRCMEPKAPDISEKKGKSSQAVNQDKENVEEPQQGTIDIQPEEGKEVQSCQQKDRKEKAVIQDEAEQKPDPLRQRAQGTEQHGDIQKEKPKAQQSESTPTKSAVQGPTRTLTNPSERQTAQSNRARAEKILANMGHVVSKWENIDGAATHRSKVQSGVDPMKPLTIQEQLNASQIIARNRKDPAQEDTEKKKVSDKDEKSNTIPQEQKLQGELENEKTSETQQQAMADQPSEQLLPTEAPMEHEGKRMEGCQQQQLRRQTAQGGMKGKKHAEETKGSGQQQQCRPEFAPLSKVVEKRKEAQKGPVMAPLTLFLEPGKNDMNSEEMRRMSELAGRKNGHSRYDYTSPMAKIIYRCPIGGCAKNANQPRKGQPVNPNGIAKKLKSHIAQERPDIGRDVLIRVIRRNRRSREVFIPCPKKRPRQNRKGRAWNEEDGMEGPSHLETQDHPIEENEESSDDSDLQSNPVPQSSQPFMSQGTVEFPRIQCQQAHELEVSAEQSKTKGKGKPVQSQEESMTTQKDQTKASSEQSATQRIEATQKEKCPQEDTQAPTDEEEEAVNWEAEQAQGSEQVPSTMDEHDSLEFEESESIKPGTIKGQNGSKADQTMGKDQNDPNSQQSTHDHDQQQRAANDTKLSDGEAKPQKESSIHHGIKNASQTPSSTIPTSRDKVDATVNPGISRTFPSEPETHLQWLGAESVGSESADERQYEDMEFDDATSEISSTP